MCNRMPTCTSLHEMRMNVRYLLLSISPQTRVTLSCDRLLFGRGDQALVTKQTRLKLLAVA